MMELTVEEGRRAYGEAIERVGQHPEIIEAWQEEAGQLQEKDAFDASPHLLYYLGRHERPTRPFHGGRDSIGP